jgi:rsbT co-antagonist protein RsbR
LLEGISTYQASMAIVDITGVSMVDSQVANMILQAAQAVRLLGAHVILTGIGPEMAQTLVQLGANLSGVRTCGTLESAVAEALQKDTTPLQKSHTLSSYTKR